MTLGPFSCGKTGACCIDGLQRYLQSSFGVLLYVSASMFVQARASIDGLRWFLLALFWLFVLAPPSPATSSIHSGFQLSGHARSYNLWIFCLSSSTSEVSSTRCPRIITVLGLAFVLARACIDSLRRFLLALFRLFVLAPPSPATWSIHSRFQLSGLDRRYNLWVFSFLPYYLYFWWTSTNNFVTSLSLPVPNSCPTSYFHLRKHCSCPESIFQTCLNKIECLHIWCCSCIKASFIRALSKYYALLMPMWSFAPLQIYYVLCLSLFYLVSHVCLFVLLGESCLFVCLFYLVSHFCLFVCFRKKNQRLMYVPLEFNT